MAALHGAGQRLEADVIGTAVAADGQDLEVVLDLALLLHDLVGALHTGGHSGGVLESGVDVAVIPCGEGVLEGGDLQAGGGVADDCLVSGLHGAHHGAAGDARAAAGAETVTGLETLGLAHLFFQIVSHITAHPLSDHAGPCGNRWGRPRRWRRSSPAGQTRAWPVPR